MPGVSCLAARVVTHLITRFHYLLQNSITRHMLGAPPPDSEVVSTLYLSSSASKLTRSRPQPTTIWEPPTPPRRLAWVRSSSGSSSQHKRSAHMVKKNEGPVCSTGWKSVEAETDILSFLAQGNSQTTPPPSPHLSRASTFRSGTTQKSGSGSSRSKTSFSSMIPRSFLPRKREESDVKPHTEHLVNTDCCFAAE